MKDRSKRKNWIRLIYTLIASMLILAAFSSADLVQGAYVNIASIEIAKVLTGTTIDLLGNILELQEDKPMEVNLYQRALALDSGSELVTGLWTNLPCWIL